MRMKTLFALCLAAMLAATMLGTSAVAQFPVRVFVDGDQVQFDQPPIVVGSRVLVPLRGIFEKMGAFVEWNPANRTVRAVRGTTVVELQIGSRVARVNGNPITLDVPAQIVGGRTLVPLRFISESLGARVDYDAPTRTVNIITTPGAGPAPPPPQPTGQTVKGVITAVVLAQTAQDFPTVTVEAGNIAYRVRVTVDTAITRIESSSGAGGSVGVAALKPGDDAEVTFANNVATRIRATYLLTRGRIEAVARAGATLVLTDGRSIKWNSAVVVMRGGNRVPNGVEALQKDQTVELRLNPTTREAWEITILSGTAETTGEMTLSVSQPRPGATVRNPVRVTGETVGGAEVEIVVTWFLGAQVGRRVLTAGSNGRFNTTVPVTVITPNSPYLITVTARHPQRGQRSVQFTVTVT